LNFVNALFWDEFGESYEPLVAHRKQITREPAVEIMLAEVDTGGKVSSDELRREEAKWVAARVRELLDSCEPIVWDNTAPREQPRARAVRPGDIAILFRALTGVEEY